MRWNLDNIYKSFNSKEFKRDFKSVDKDVIDFSKWIDEKIKREDVEKAEILVEYLKKLEELLAKFRKLGAFCSLTKSVDSSNQTAASYMEKIQKKRIPFRQLTIKMEKWICEIEDLEAVIDSSEKLQEYEFYLKRILEMDKYSLDVKTEEIISKFKTTGSDAWANLQGKISSELEVEIDIDGKQKMLPLAEVRNLAYSRDGIVRKKAYQAELEAYKKIEASSAAALNSIKGEVLTLCELRGFKSPLEQTLINSKLKKESLDAMLGAMKEAMPYFHKYLRKKAELLGYPKALPFYELFAPVGEIDLSFTLEEAKDFIVEHFASFSQELSDFAKNAFENNWLDTEPRAGKRGGAFCAGIHPIGESRILANFNGSFSNLTTLAHELGHAFHGHCLKEESSLNTRYPMPLAETASIFCETIVAQAAMKKLSEAERKIILEARISSSTQIICDIYSRYLFETELFERRKESSLSVEELKEIMLEAQKKSYGKGLEKKYLHPYMWLNKPHYYYAGANFYNFPYAFGKLFALGLFSKFKEEGEEFVPKYKELLKLTGKDYIENVTNSVGIDITTKDFWNSSLEIIKENINEFIK